MPIMKSDYVILIPPPHLEHFGIIARDFTAINASTNNPKETKPSLEKVKEMIFLALLQGYEVTSDKHESGSTIIRIIPHSEVVKLSKEYRVVSKDES